MKRAITLMLVLAFAVSSYAGTGVSVRTVDFLKVPGVNVNAAGPVLLLMDERRNRLIAANTISSSMTVLDCGTNEVDNIPLGGRAFQHLKSEALTCRHETGDVYLVGAGCFYIVSPGNGNAVTVDTRVQFESVAVDEKTGNVFLAGRESKQLGFYDASAGRLRMIDWLDFREDLINLNATPPPPIRKVIADGRTRRIIAVDGIDPALYILDADNGALVESRPLGLTAGGRWHLAGYDETDGALFIVVETVDRRVIETARIDVFGGEDEIVTMPEFTEGVGICYNPGRSEVYVAYDNHPSVHVVGFGGGGEVELAEIKIPAYGNDASAVDRDRDLLYVASWAFGEIDVIDLATRRLRERITDLGIIPHMFTMAFSKRENLIYFPKGATAVNGTFGAAISVLDPVSRESGKIYTGWAPVDLIELEGRGSFLVFSSEDQLAEVRPDGSYDLHRLPGDYPISAVHNHLGDVYLSYGPHQSYWPTVYIWGAKNGILTISSKDLSFYDRRIPRQAHEMAVDGQGALYFSQNNWGREEQFVGVLEDEVRLFDSRTRIALGDTVEREITQRILRYDETSNRLYLVRTGERDDDPSLLQVIDTGTGEVLGRVTLGLTATDLEFDGESIYVANFDSESVTIVDKATFRTRIFCTGRHPIKLCRCMGGIYAISHGGGSIEEIDGKAEKFDIPYEGTPDNVVCWGDRMVITVHGPEALSIVQFDPSSGSFELLHREEYPFGDTSFDTRNVSFYVRGQFADALFRISRAEVDCAGRLWITDFLSGKLFVLTRA